MNNTVNVRINTTALADGSQSGGICEELKLNGVRVLDVTEFIRASNVTVLDRGNRRQNVSLTISTLYATPLAALQAALGANEATLNIADLTLTFGDGTNTLTATMRRAGWQPVAPEPKGQSVVTRYEITGPKFDVSVAAGAGPSIYALPVIHASDIAPVTVPADTSASVGAGEMLVCRELIVNGGLSLDPLGEIHLIN